MVTKRLIDANELVRRYEKITTILWNQNCAPISWADAYEKIIVDIEDAPSVDAVEVTRCKDCKHWKTWNVGGGWCEAWEIMRRDNGYCDYGERKDNG